MPQPSLRFTLSFVEGNGVLQLEDRPLAVGGLAERLALDIPGLKFPFDLSGGLARFQNRHSRLRELVLSFTGAEIARIVAGAPLADFGIHDPILELSAGGVRLGGQARVGGCAADFTARATLRPLPLARLAVCFDDLRLYGFLPVPAPLLARAVFSALVARGTASWATGAFQAASATRLELAALELSLFPLLPANGWRLPEQRQVRLQSVEVGPGGVHLHFLRTPAGAPVEPESPGVVSDFAEAEAAILSGDLSFARAAYQQAHARAPADELPRQRLLQLLAASADLSPELERAAEEMAATTPDHPAVLLAQAQVASQRGQPAQAARVYLRAAELAEAAGETLDAACARGAAAEQQQRAGQGPASTSELERAHALRPDHRGILGALRRRFQVEARWDDLLRILWQQAAAATDPIERAALLSASGLVLLDPLGKADLARERFDQARHLHGEDAGAWEGVGRLEAGQGNRQAALASLDQAARRYARAEDRAGQARVEVALGRLQEAAGARDEALVRFRRAAEIDGGAPEAILAGAALLDQQGRLPEAVDLIREALARATEPPDRVRLYRRLATLEQGGRRDPLAAVRWLEEALREAPADVGALEDLARILDREGEPGRLEPFLRRAAAAARPGPQRQQVGRLCEERGRASGSSSLRTEGLALLAAEGGRAGAEQALALADLGDSLESGTVLRRAADAIETLLAAEGTTGADPLPLARLANRLASLRLREGDRTASEKLSHRALDSYPDPDAAGQAWQTIVRCALERGDVTATRAGLAGWAEDGRVADAPTARAGRLAEAGALERERLGSAALAASLFERALALDPENRAALQGLAAALEERQQWPRLEELLQQILAHETDPEVVRDLRHRLAETLVRQSGRGQEATRIYESLQAQDADDLRASLGLGRALWQSGRLEQSVKQFGKVLVAEDRSAWAAEAHLRLAQAARLFGEVEKAERHLQQATRAEPEQGAPAEVLVEVLESFGQTDELVDLLQRRRAGATNPRLAQELARALGGVLERVGRADDAVAVYRSLLAASPDDVESLQRLAEIFRRDARPEELLPPLEHLLQLASQHGETGDIDVEAIGLELMGLLEETGAESDRVEALLRQVLAVRPDSTHVLQALLQRLERQPGRLPEAFATLALLHRQNLKTARGLALDQPLVAMAASPGLDQGLARSVLEEAAVAQGGGGELVDALVGLYRRMPGEADRVDKLRGLLQRMPGLAGPSRVRIHLALAAGAEGRSDWATAAAELGQALAFEGLTARRANHLAARARIGLMIGDLPAGRSDLQAALDAAPDHPDALLQLADLCETDEDWRAALGLLDRLAAAAGGEALVSRERLAFRRAMAALRADDPGRAAAGFEEVLAIDPDHVHAREMLVEVHQRAGNLEGARGELERLTAAHPERTASWTALGELYERSGLHREAADALGGLARSLAEPRPRAETLLRRGDLLRDRLADVGAAQDAYLLAHDADPSFLQPAVRLIESRWRAGHLGAEALADRVIELARQAGDPGALAQALALLAEADDGALLRALRPVLGRRATDGSRDEAADAVRQWLSTRS